MKAEMTVVFSMLGLHEAALLQVAFQRVTGANNSTPSRDESWKELRELLRDCSVKSTATKRL